MDDFTLNTAQIVFMMNAEDSIRKAEEEEDGQFFLDLVASEEYKRLFGEMSVDQAIDQFMLRNRSLNPTPNPSPPAERGLKARFPPLSVYGEGAGGWGSTALRKVSDQYEVTLGKEL